MKYELVTRRNALKILGLAGVSLPAGGALLAQERARVTSEVLEMAEAILGEEFTDERLEVIAAALQANLDQFQLVRELEIHDLVEPPVLFVADWS